MLITNPEICFRVEFFPPPFLAYLQLFVSRSHGAAQGLALLTITVAKKLGYLLL
jgi:hypothetical protein